MADWLRKGHSRRAFKNSGNYTHARAQKRFDEAVPSFHQKIENSLQVDGNVGLLFKQIKLGLGRPCTCNKYAVDDQHAPNRTDDDPVLHDVAPSAPVMAPQASDMDGVEIKIRKDNLFGDSGLLGMTEEGFHHGDMPQETPRVRDLAELDHRVADPSSLNEDHLADLDPELQAYYEDNVFAGNSINCGVCYKTGSQPGFECLDHQYCVMTNYDIVSSQGYHVDQSAHPAQMQKHADEGFIVFTVDVPKFFKTLTYSIRDNEKLIKFNHILDINTNQPVTMKDLDPFRGGQYSFKVESKNFTHVTLLFDLAMEPLMINVTDEANTLEISREDTIGNLSLVMPARIGHISSGDIVYLPHRNIALKITDAPRKQKANRTIIEWAVQTRTLQPQEPVRNIAKGYKVE